ncbi:hypothetical protein NDI52_32240 [Leptolyngbya sp. PL-A3]|uniref:hypothetical protein n=1 Tax=Leptolyngbya sp. PL-A3 TaxID=2933911 RepID=UPI00329862B9
MKTLIITVGTRQIGWRCKDGIVRSFGADGDRGHPPHIDQLYAEFGEERGYHGDATKPEWRWSVRHLGKIAYQQCAAAEDFSSVELLLDGVILAEQIQDGLSHVILWGTDQPEEVPWNFRRGDTLWLAKLMAGKIRQVYPQLQVDVWKPVVAVNQVESIRREVESFIVQYALERLIQQETDAPLTLQIQTKGSVPQIANTLEICAAALMRQCPVEQLVPIEPSPLFEEVHEGCSGACPAQTFSTISLGQYFWPVERERIVSAWRRGDFTEARVWLESHRDRYEYLYELADCLALTTNWQLDDALKCLREWIDRPSTKRQASKKVRQDWRAQVQAMLPPGNSETASSKFFKIWESCFLLRIELCQQNFTAAFMQFAQTLERLLFWRYQLEDWINLGYIVLPPEKQNWGVKYKASLAELRLAWQKQQGLAGDEPLCQQLETINELRNSVVHRSTPLTLEKLASELWPDLSTPSVEVIYAAMEERVQGVCPADWPKPSQSLLQTLYEWGLEQLQN